MIHFNVFGQVPQELSLWYSYKYMLRKLTQIFGIVSLVIISLAPIVYAAPEDAPDFELTWGSTGNGVGQFNFPFAIMVDEDGTVHVSDQSNNEIQEFDTDGGFEDDWSSAGATGLTIDDEGYVYVTQSSLGTRRVRKYEQDGTLVLEWGASGNGNGQFGGGSGNFGPTDVEYNPVSGEILVADNGNHRIQRFNKTTGAYIGQWGSFGTGEGLFNRPKSIAVAANGNVYVAEEVNDRVQIFTSTGSYLGVFGGSGSEDGQLDGPLGIAIDQQDGYVYISDTLHKKIQKFDEDGNYLAQWGSDGDGEGEFNAPRGIAVFENSVFVVDGGNNRVQKFAYPDEPDPTATPSPTATPTSSSSSPSRSRPSAPGCHDSTPQSAPVLFQVTRMPTSATLYFAPVKGTSGYFISYGLGSVTEQFGTSFTWPDQSGVLTYTISDLDPKATYTFKVRGQNGCQPGSWSNEQRVTGTSGRKFLNFYLPSLW